VKRVAGFDLGEASLGIAISDGLGITHPREEFRFPRKAYRRAIAHAIEFLHREGVNEVALGYPYNMDGTLGASAERSRRFKDELLAEDASLNIHLVDERLTTVEASENLAEAGLTDWQEQKAHIDEEAACVILESYLSSLPKEKK
jgi:putative holliday junction resolvase